MALSKKVVSLSVFYDAVVIHWPLPNTIPNPSSV